jgi:hypothetical protein
MLRKKNEVSQSAVEFALVIPVLLLLIFGMLLMGHIIFVYASVLNASREAARYGAVTGLVGGKPQYQDCAGITAAAIRLRFLANFTDSDVQIMYDGGPGTTPIGPCSAMTSGQWSSIGTGSRIVVTITSPYAMVIPLIPIGPFDMVSTSARTILGSVAIAGTVVAPPPAAFTYTPTATRTQTQTPTLSPTPTSTSTSTATLTLTPLFTRTITRTPTITMTPTVTTTLTPTVTKTLTPTTTLTPTVTSTARCDQVFPFTPTPPPFMLPTSTPPRPATANELIFVKTIYNTNPDPVQVSKAIMTYRDLVNGNPKRARLATSIYPGNPLSSDIITDSQRTVDYSNANLFIPAGGQLTFYVYYENVNKPPETTLTTDFISLTIMILNTNPCSK